MRQLACVDLQQIMYLDNTHFYTIVIENPSFYHSFVQKIINQIERGEDEYLVLSDETKIIELRKKGIIVTDLFRFDFEERKMSTQLYKYIATNYETKYLLDDFHTVTTAINVFMAKLKDVVSIEVDYEDEYTIGDLAKFANLHVSFSNEAFIYTLVDFIKAYLSLKGIEIFIFLNLKKFLNQSQHSLLCKEAHLLGVHFIDIETSKSTYQSEDEFCIVIDNDICEYYPIVESK